MEFFISNNKLSSFGIYQYGIIKTSEIKFSQEVRKMCEDNVCGLYNKTWACPPAVGAVEECKKKCLSFEYALVFSSKYDLEDSFDYDSMSFGHKQFKKVCDKLNEETSKHRTDYLLLSNEGCIRCKKCTYPDNECVFIDKLFPSIEGFGIFVNQIAESAGINYVNGPNTATYFGALLFNENAIK